MWSCAVARNQRGALTQAGAGIAASRLARWSISRGYSILAGEFWSLQRFEVTMAHTLPARFGAALALTLMAFGCAAGRPSIAELKYNPGRYHDRTVSLEGVVTSSWNVPLVPFKLYKLNDGTGEVTVVANDGRVPTKGARVRVKGRVSDVATLGGQPIGLHLQQRDVDFRR